MHNPIPTSKSLCFNELQLKQVNICNFISKKNLDFLRYSKLLFLLVLSASSMIG